MKCCETDRQTGNRYDLQQVEIDIFRALFLCGSFMEAWCSAVEQPEGRWPPPRASTQNSVTLLVDDRLLSLLTDCRLPGVENFCYYIFSVRPHILPTQFTWHFRCSLYTLKHSCTSCFWNSLWAPSQSSTYKSCASCYKNNAKVLIHPSWASCYQNIA